MLQRTITVDDKPFEVRLARGLDARWERVERELTEVGLPLPLAYRSAWLARMPQTPWLLHASDDRGAACAIALAESRTRAMPGHRVLRAERVGVARSHEALRAALLGLTALVSSQPSVLRVELATFSFDPDERASLRSLLPAVGFSRCREPRVYERTTRVDLDGDEQAVLARFHATARRHLRAVDRHPVELRTITEPEHAAELESLTNLARERTGGRPVERPWRELLELSRRHPELLRFVGLFRDSGELLAFASGHAQGDHVTYADAGSARPSDIKLPLGYGPAWELMRWARSLGMRWFDFGGIAASSREGRLGGINDFKRYFRGEETDVADEWAFEPHPMRAALANTLSAAASWWRERSRNGAIVRALS
jgi:hypothetical protein